MAESFSRRVAGTSPAGRPAVRRRLEGRGRRTGRVSAGSERAPSSGICVPDAAGEQDRVAPRGRRTSPRRPRRRLLPDVDHAVDGAGIEVGAVGEDDDGCLDVVAERARGRSGALRPGRAPSRGSAPTGAVVSTGCAPSTTTTSTSPRAAAARPPRGEQRLLRPAEAGRRAGREHDCRRPSRYGLTVTLSSTTFSVGCSVASPSLPILSTTSSPSVTWPTIA